MYIDEILYFQDVLSVPDIIISIHLRQAAKYQPTPGG